MSENSQPWEPRSRESARSASFWARPLVPLLGALVAGILAGDRFPGLPAAGMVLAAGSVLLLCLLLAQKKAARLSPLFLFFALGYLAILPWTRQELSPDHLARFLDKGFWHVTGTVMERPEQLPDRTRLVLDRITLSRDGASRKVKGRLRLTVRPPVSTAAKGQAASFYSSLRSFHNFNNPGGFDYVSFMRRKGISGSAYVGGKRPLSLSAPENQNFSCIHGLRLAVSRLIDQSAPGEAAPVLKALVLGEKRRIKPDIRQAFARTGTAHLLAISGLHMGMVAGFSLLVFRFIFFRVEKLVFFGFANRLAALCAFFPALGYGLLAGMSPSTQRALVMVGVFLASFLVQKRYEPFNTLAAAALAILAVFPPALFSASFQLSFFAAFTILYFLTIWPLARRLAAARGSLRARIALLPLISLFATLGTLPLVLDYFHQVSLAGPLVNVLAVPLVGFFILPAGLLATALLPVFPWLSLVLMQWSGWALEGLVRLILWLSAMPWVAVMPIKPSIFESLLYYVVLFSLPLVRKKKAAPWVLAAGLALLIADAGYWYHKRFMQKSLEITILDVGQGNAALVRFPKGKTLLLDGGGFSGSAFDTGQRLIAPYLWDNKIHSLDFMALSHPQQDHAGGMPYIAENFSVGEFWHNGQGSGLKSYGRLINAFAEKGVPMRTFSGLCPPRIVQGVRVTALHPAPGFADSCAPDADLNNNSLVLKLDFGSFSFLFPGDIEAPAEKAILSRYGPGALKSTVALAPHHGSASSSTPAWVRAVSPDTLVVSSGWNQRKKFPDRKVLQRFRQEGAGVLTTAENGAVTFVTDGKKLATSVRKYPSCKQRPD